MSYILVIGEKPDIGTKYAASLGGVILSSGQELTMGTINKYASTIKSDRFKKGYFEGIAKKSNLKGERIIYSWCFGHIASLLDAKDYDESYAKWSLDKYPFIPEEFKRKISKDFQKHFKLLKELMTSSDCKYIINGTDGDREGELIFDDIYTLSYSKRPVKRLWLNETNEEGIILSFNNLIDYKKMIPLRDSARGRAYSDWIVGINMTVISTLMFGNGELLSIGRVQTPTLDIVTTREREIEQFNPKKFYELEGEFNKEYTGLLTINDKTKFDDEKLIKNIIEEIKDCKTGKIKKVITSKQKEIAPMFYDLGTLQGDANSKYGFTLKKTLDLVQSLYEKGILSYPRTDCRTIPEREKYRLKKIPYIVEELYPDYSKQMTDKGIKLGSRYIKNTTDAHFAIIPVGKPNLDKLSLDEKKIFSLVAQNIIAAFLGDALWSQTQITTEVKEYNFVTTGKTLIEKGFREIIPVSKEEIVLPLLKEGDKVKVNKISKLTKQTKPPQRYTEKTLNEAMKFAGKNIENEEIKEVLKGVGIGTSATRADIIEKLIRVKYIERSGKSLKPTQKGLWLINNLPIDEIKKAEMTGQWELRLDNIARGEEDLDTFIENIKVYTIENCKKLKDSAIKIQKESSDKESVGLCPLCGNPMYENDISFYCSNWKAGCKGSIWKKNKDKSPKTYGGKKITKTLVKQLLSKKETNILTFKTDDGQVYSGKLCLDTSNGYINIKIRA